MPLKLREVSLALVLLVKRKVDSKPEQHHSVQMYKLMLMLLPVVFSVNQTQQQVLLALVDRLHQHLDSHLLKLEELAALEVVLLQLQLAYLVPSHLANLKLKVFSEALVKLQQQVHLVDKVASAVWVQQLKD